MGDMAMNGSAIVDFPELREHGIKASRVTIAIWMDRGIFPPAVRVSPNRIGWIRSDIELFLSSRPSATEPAPVLWPPRQRPPKPADPSAKPRGRPRGSRIVVDEAGRRRLVLPDHAGVGFVRRSPVAPQQ